MNTDRGATALGSERSKVKKHSEMYAPVFNCEAYWKCLWDKMPELAVVVRVGFASCATEAATERTFSSEGMMHNKLRNRMDHDLVNSVLKVRWNFEACARVAARTGHFAAFKHVFSNVVEPDSDGDDAWEDEEKN